jgi:hypothetical protein
MDRIEIESPYTDYYATQNGRAVEIVDKDTDERRRFEPPAEWGHRWAWNLTEKGIYFCRT